MTKRTVDLIAEPLGIEYIIWGYPPNNEYENLLYSKARSMAQAKDIMAILAKEHGCTDMRVQVLDMSEGISSQDFAATVNPLGEVSK